MMLCALSSSRSCSVICSVGVEVMEVVVVVVVMMVVVVVVEMLCVLVYLVLFMCT